MRESLEPPPRQVKRAAKGNGNTGGVRSGTFLVRQMITESVALSCCGAVLGLALAMTGARALAHLQAFNLPLLATIRIDGRALAFTLLAAVATGVLFGPLPALQVSALSMREGLRNAGRRTSAGKRHAWIRDGLVVSEIAFTCILLMGAGLLMRSFCEFWMSSWDFNLSARPR